MIHLSKFPLILFWVVPLFTTACTQNDLPSTDSDQTDTTRKPNILLIIADDLGWHDLGIYGDTFIETPHLDQLAEAGVRFTNAYAPASLCSPSRASLMTGLHPVEVNITEHIHGPFRPDPSIPLITPDIDQSLGARFVTLGEMLQDEEYFTAYVGKWHLGGGNAGPARQGFDSTFAASFHGLPNSFYYPFFEQGMEDIRAEAQPGDYLTDVLTQKTIDLISERDTFFAVLSYYSPHVPIEGPTDLVEKYVAKRGGDEGLPNPHYAAMVESIDQNVGRLLAALEASGKLENTLVIFTSDNGGLSVEEVPAFAQHTPPTDNGPLRAGKGYLYEGGIRVPLMIHWPQVVAGGRVVDEPVVGTDVMATITEALELSSAGSEYQSLLSTGSAGERAIFWHVPHYSPQGGKPASAIRKGKYKLIEFYEDEHVELYDLEADLSETNNLADAQPQVAEDLLRELQAWKQEKNAQLPVPNPNYEGE